MIAAIVNFELKMNHIQDGVTHWSKALEEMVNLKQKEKKSIKGWTLVVNHSTGHGKAIGFWENSQDAHEHGKSSEYQESIKKLQMYCSKPPVRELYEVVGGNIVDVKIPNMRMAA